MRETLKQLFPDPVIKEEDFEKYKRARGLYIEDPWQRVKTIFMRDDFGNMHPELLRASQITQYGFVFGAAMGAVKESVKRSKEFIRTNDTNVYLSKNEMYRVMANKSMIAMGQGGLKWGPKVGLFAGGFSLVASCCEAYRNKSGIIEYVIGGYLAGGFSRSALGIKGFIAGGIIGASLGFLVGVLQLGLEKLTKKDALSFKYTQFAYMQHRNNLFEKMRGSNKIDSATQLTITMHGEHIEDPLNALDVQHKKPESEAEK